MRKLLPPKLSDAIETDSKNNTLIKKHQYNTRNKNLPNVPLRITKQYRKSILYNSLKLFNSLPKEIKDCKSFKLFGNKCKHFLLDING